MHIILSTRNPTKAIEIKMMLSEFGVGVLTLDEAGVMGEAVEDGETLEENAEKKINHALAQLSEPSWVMADDSGIFISALGGLPGIHAARWAGESATTLEILQHTLRMMDKQKDRSAVLETVIVLQSPEGRSVCFKGRTAGSLATAPKASPKPGMPYTAIFSPDGQSRVLAEMTIAEQKGVSSRGKAIEQLIDFIKVL